MRQPRVCSLLCETSALRRTESKKRIPMKRKRETISKILIALSLLLIVGASVFLFCFNQKRFIGSRVKNPDAYFLDIEKMNGTDLHILELRKDDVLQIQFETEKGSLYMEIKAPDGTYIYSGNGKETKDFTVTIPESGIYTVIVEARHAKGIIHIQLKEGA